MTRPLRVHPAWRYGLAWLLAMAAIMGFVRDWQDADWWLYAHISRQPPPPLSPQLLLVDVPHSLNSVAEFRRRLASLMALLATQPAAAPRAVVFDVKFTAADDEIGLIQAAVRRLQGQGVKVFALYNPLDDACRVSRMEKADHAQALYENVLDGRGHSCFGEQRSGLIKFDPWLAIGDGESVSALPVSVAQGLGERPANAAEKPIIVRAGKPEALAAQTLRFDPQRQRLLQGDLPLDAAALAPRLRGKVVVVGSVDADRPLADNVSGPALVVWALSGRLASREVPEVRLLADPALRLGLMLVGAALSAALVRGVYLRFARSHTHTLALLLPAAAVPLALLAAAVGALAANDLAMPEVSLPVLAVLLAAVLAWLCARRVIVLASMRRLPYRMAEEYDVFVSYRRQPPDHERWVQTHVYQPLRAARGPQGRPLRVFLDRQVLLGGDDWYRRIGHAIDASRFFLAVYSEDYFLSPNCTAEFRQALVRHSADSKVIIAIGLPPELPTESKDLQALVTHLHAVPTADRAGQPRDFLPEVLQAMVQAREAAPVPATAALKAGGSSAE